MKALTEEPPESGPRTGAVVQRPPPRRQGVRRLPLLGRAIVEIVVVAVAYYAAARFGLWLAFEHTNASPVWPPSGIAFAAVLLRGPRIWPGIWIGAFLANAVVFAGNMAAVSASVVGLSSCIAVGNVLEAVSGAMLMRRLAVAANPTQRSRDVFMLVLVTAVMCLVSSIVGAASLYVGGIIPQALCQTVWFTWWLGDACGVLVLTPLLLTCCLSRGAVAPTWSAVEGGVFLSLLLFTGQIVFGGWLNLGIAHHALSFALIPFLVWAAFRFGPDGVVCSAFVIAGIAIWGTIHGRGPFLRDALNDSMLLLQAFLGISTVTGLVLAAVLTEHRHAEDRFRAVVEGAPNAMLMINQAGEIVLVNPQVERMFGYGAKELVGRRVELLIPERYRPRHPEYRAGFFAAPSARHMGVGRDLFGLRRDGTEFPVEIGINRLETGAGPRVLAVIIDITERKRAEAERQKFVSLAESSQEFIGMCDREFNPFYVNAAGMRLVGLDNLAAACRVKVQDCFFPEDQPFITGEFFPRVLRDGHGEVEIRFRHFKTGEAIWMLYNVFNIRDASGATVGWATVSRNIHDRRRAEEALRESEGRLRLAQQAAHIGAFEWNIQSGVNIWTPELEVMYGLQPGEFSKTQPAWAQLVHPDDRAEAVKCTEQAIQTGLPTEGEWRVIWPDGSVHWIAGRFQVFRDKTGATERLTGINIDITERKQAAEQLKVTLDQLQALTAHLESVREEERTRIAREIHDEFGQALTILKLDLAWIKGQLTRHDLDQRDGLRDLLCAKTQEMSDLIGATMQTMRRIVTELRPGILDKFGLAAALEWQGQEFQKRTGIRCTVEVGEYGLDRDRATALFRIVQEALTNVARHARATTVDVRSFNEAQNLLLVIEDNGAGLGEQANSVRQSFGLLGMRERAQAAGGRLSIESSPGRGTRINVQVPLPLPRPQPHFVTKDKIARFEHDPSLDRG